MIRETYTFAPSLGARWLCGAACALTLACGGGREPAPSASAAPSPEAESKAQPLEARRLDVVVVEARPFERTLVLPAELAALQDVAIHARVPGFIESIAVDRGSAVRRGATLARIVAPELVAQLRSAEADVQTAEATLAEAQAALAGEQSTFQRLKQASATPGVVAGNDVEVALQRVEALEARVHAAMKTVESRQAAARSVRELEAYLRVTAPFDGVVTERAAHVGSLVGPASGSIVRIQQVSTLRLVTPIPEAQVGTVGIGQTIEFAVATFPGETLRGRLARRARALDPGTRTMAVEIDVENGAGRLAPGMFAEVRWPVRREGTSLFVPRSAVATTTERTFVVRVRNGATEWVDVRRGAAMGDVVEVIGAVAAGDEVAMRATDELRPGTRVQPARRTGE